MFSHIGADMTEAEVVSLGSDQRRLLVALAATTRVAPFLAHVPDDVPTYGIGDIHRRLLSGIGSDQDVCERLASELPGLDEMRIPDADEGSEVWPSAFLVESFFRAIWACLEFLATRNWEEPAIACGAVLEAMEMWAEYDLGRSWSFSDVRADPQGFRVRKYTFEPVMAELGAQRLDLSLAGRDDPNVEQLLLERAVRQGEWLEQRFAAWEQSR